MTRPTPRSQAGRRPTHGAAAPLPTPEALSAQLAALTAPGAGSGASFGRPPVLRLVVALGAVCPWRVAERLGGVPTAAWHDAAAHGGTWVARGALATVARIHTPVAQRRLRQVTEALVTLPLDLPHSAAQLLPRLPVWVGSWPFFAGHALPKAAPGVARVRWPKRRPFVLPAAIGWRAAVAGGAAPAGAQALLALHASLPGTAAGQRRLARALLLQVARWRRAAAQCLAPRQEGEALEAAAPQAGAGPGAALHGGQAACARDRKHYCARVAALLADLRRGALSKVVLARPLHLAAPKGHAPDVWRTLWTLRQQNPTATTFLRAYGAGTCFVGATPETLAAVHRRGWLVTHALAGTRRRAATAAADARVARALTQSDKDRREHGAVYDGLLTAIGPLCFPPARRARPRALATRTLWHLHTPIALRLRAGRDLLHAVAAMHPTPAVGGTPTPAALRRLAAEEPWRGDFAAPMGYVTQAGGRFVVALRALLLTRTGATAFAGAGIVQGSVPAQEWQETEHKLACGLAGLIWRLVSRKPRVQVLPRPKG